jgi:ribosome-associated toxin RatA of RatAB toxin-antitoxin module
MHSTVSTEIGAPPELVFRLARDIERWPQLLPHYLRVRWEAGRPNDRPVLRMIAVRPSFGLAGLGLPVVWRARTWAEPETRRLRFQHLGGVTAGMDVTWRIEPTAAGCHVEIEHAFRRRLPIPVLGARLGDELLPAFVDRFFTRPIARRTLATFKSLAEAIARDTTSDPAVAAYPLT